MYDLFGQVPVTWPEIEAWCLTVAHIGKTDWRLKYYVEYWNVAQKIREWKLKNRRYTYTGE